MCEYPAVELWVYDTDWLLCSSQVKRDLSFLQRIHTTLLSPAIVSNLQTCLEVVCLDACIMIYLDLSLQG